MMKKLLALYFLVIVSKVGVSVNIDGGSNANSKQFPFFISLRNQNEHWCGGAILDELTIITSAHCVKTVGPNSDFMAYAGYNESSEQRPLSDPNNVWFYEVVVHEKFNPYTMENDIALVKTTRTDGAFDLDTDYARPVKLPAKPKVDPEPESKLTLVGAGESGDNFKVMPKKFVKMRYVPDKECNVGYEGRVKASMICAGEDGKDACSRDSGSPSVDDDGTLVGIVSWGRIDKECQGLARFPGVYTQVSYYLDWIEANRK